MSIELHDRGFSESAPKLPAARHAARAQLDMVSSFLFDTLVLRPSMHRRDGVIYFSVRRRRTAIKRHQIDALKALKVDPPMGFVDAVVADILAALDPLLPPELFHCVVPVPGGHSGAVLCLSELVAIGLGFRLGLPVIAALSIEPSDGSSHPRQNISRPRMRLERPVDGPVIVIDDVATSGSHIEEAIKLIRPEAHAVFAVAWIDGATEAD